MAIARKFIDKNVLLNVIRHTDAHNKVFCFVHGAHIATLIRVFCFVLF